MNSFIKKTILIILICFILFLHFPQKTLAQSVPHSFGNIESIGGYTVSAGSNNPIEYFSKLENIFSLIVSFMTILTGLFFIIHFIVGGFTWSTAGGDSQKVETAKTKMTNAAIGLIIVIASYSIIYIIGKVLGLDILKVGSLLLTMKPS